MARKSSAIIRNFRPEDKSAVLDLYQACWDSTKRNSNQACWEWLNELNPNIEPDRPVTFVLEREGRIIGTVSMVPAELMIMGTIYKCNWSMDLMVHPECRGGLTGYRLVKEVIQRSASYIGTGLPIRRTVPLWLRAGSKVGVDEVGAFGPMVLPCDCRYVLKHKTLNPLVTGPLNLLFKPAMACYRWFRAIGAQRSGKFRTRHIDRFDERITRFFESVGPEYPIIVVRDEAYLNWRYTRNPSRSYIKLIAEDEQGDIRGYIVYRANVVDTGIREGLLVDYLVRRGDEAVMRLLLKEAIRYFRQKRCDVIKTLELHMPDIRNYFSRMGFMPHPVKPYYLIFYNEICSDQPKSFFTDQRNWYITRNFADQEINESFD